MEYREVNHLNCWISNPKTPEELVRTLLEEPQGFLDYNPNDTKAEEAKGLDLLNMFL